MQATADATYDYPDADMDKLLALERDEARERAQNGILNFCCYMHPAYEVNWHHVVIGRLLNAFVKGTVNRLIISAPPRSGKSELVSRQLPAFLLGQNPDMEIMSASYAAPLARQMNRDVQKIMMHERYSELFPHTQLNAKNIRTAGTCLRNSEVFEVVGRRGRYQCSGIGGALTGSGADVAIIDDPTKNWDDANSPLYRERTWNWYTSTLRTRMSKTGRIVVVSTRWHEDDLVGRLMEQMKDPKAEQWVILNLEAVKQSPPTAYDGRKEGEALWPERFPIETLNQIKANSLRVFQSLYQGRPSPPEGNLVQDAWWRTASRAQRPSDMSWVRISADLTFKDGEKDDFTVMQVWGGKGPDRYLIDQIREKAGFVRQCNMVYELLHRHPQISGLYIEDSANGSALVDVLKGKMQGVIAIRPKGSKVARAEACTPTIQAGNVFLPPSAEHPWVADFMQEWHDFPNGKHDDMVDATSQLLNETRESIPDDIIIPYTPKASTWKRMRSPGRHVPGY